MAAGSYLLIELTTSQVHRKLDATFKVGGIEAMDLIGVLLTAAIANLLFGRLPLAPLFVVGLPGGILVGLFFGKRGKPDGYLLDAVRFYLSPGALCAGEIKRQK